MTTHQNQAHELIMKFYLSEKGISKAMAKRLALLHIKLLLEAIDWHEFETPNKEFERWELVKTEIENYKFKK